jgi:hypothetical protein
MTAPVITGGSITGVALSGNTLTNPVITGGSINNTPIGASTASTGRFSDLTDTGLTSGRVIYASTGGNLVDDADFTFNGTTLTLANDASISGLTVGKGGGAVSNNTAIGFSALQATNSGSGNNTAVGYQAGFSNTTGDANVFIGRITGYSNTSGTVNTAVGSIALYSNTTGGQNTAVGRQALQANTTASDNTAVGYQAGYSNTTSAYNTYLGYQAGYSTTTTANTGFNTYVGHQAGYNTTGDVNTFIGQAAGQAITSGRANTIIGRYTGNQGGLDIRTANNYIVLSDGDGNPRGYFTNTGLFHSPQNYVNTTAVAANGVIESTGAFARSTSALKYKQDVRNLEVIDISKFRPVRYKSKCEADDPTKDHFGIIADEVAEAGITELVSYGADGEVEGFQYERLTVVLLKTIQDLQKRIETLENK